jgi:hypothetical protein
MVFNLIIGQVIDRGSYLPIFVAAGVLPIVAAAALILVLGPIEPIRIPTADLSAARAR